MEEMVKVTSSDMDFDKIFKLFTGRHTSTMYDRQAVVITKLATAIRKGKDRDLSSLTKVLDLIKIKLDDGAKELITPTVELFEVCSFNWRESNDDKSNTYETMTSFVQSLCPFLVLDYRDIVCGVAKLFFNLLGDDLLENGDSITVRHISSQKIFLRAIETSNLASGLVKALEKNIKTECTLPVLRTLRRISVLEACCSRMIEATAVALLLKVLRNNSESILDVLCVETLWNVLSSSSNSFAMGFITSTDLTLLKEIFESFLQRVA
ncbi:hypothetical protein BC829DRAFT_199901 [Chytridium lagenaria]|nr:hypothetical protein BC829DRAFT_199901 [Chytridium lagenaria]